MAEKTLNTRIKLKYDTLTNWETNNPVLLAGEIAIVAIPSKENPSGGISQVNKPAIVFKVGDGSSNFKALPYASALAADVYAWAKQATKPSYTAEEVNADAKGTAQGLIDSLTVEDSAVEGQFVTEVKQQNGKIVVTRANAPTAPEYTLESGTSADGSLILKKNGEIVGSEAIVKGWAELVSSINAKYTKPESGIPKTDLDASVQASLDKADSAIQDISNKIDKVIGTTDNIVLFGTEGTIKDSSKKITDFEAAGTVNTHNSAPDAHSDIRTQISGIIEQLNGRTTAYVFENKEDPLYTAAIAKTGSFKVGDTILFKDADIADQWVSAVSDSDPYYTFLDIETKHPDLNGYATKEELQQVEQKVDTNTTEITNIKNGTTVVLKASQDANGNVISTTYAKKSELGNLALKNTVGNTEITDVDMSKVTGLSDALVGKADTEHTHTTSNITDFTENVNNLITSELGKHQGIDKVGTVTSVSSGIGLKVTGDSSVNPTINIDEAVTFIFNCGNSVIE